MRTTMLSDERLCAMVAQGDGEALAELHHRYAPSIRAVGRRRLSDRSRADDLVQEVFVDVWRGAARFDPERARFSTWVRTIAARRATDFERRAAVRPPLQAYEAQELSTDDASPETIARLDVAAALSELPPAQRSTLALAFWGGMTYAEISERTRTPLGTVKSRALLGMRRLEEALAPVAGAV